MLAALSAFPRRPRGGSQPTLPDIPRQHVADPMRSRSALRTRPSRRKSTCRCLLHFTSLCHICLEDRAQITNDATCQRSCVSTVSDRGAADRFRQSVARNMRALCNRKLAVQLKRLLVQRSWACPACVCGRSNIQSSEYFSRAVSRRPFQNAHSTPALHLELTTLQ